MEIFDRRFHLWRARDEQRQAFVAPDPLIRQLHERKAAEHLACAELAAAADRQTAAVGCVGAPAPADGSHAGGFRSDLQVP